MLWNIIVSWTWYRLDRWNVMANDKSMCQPQLFIIWVIFHFHRCWLCVMNFQYIKVVCWGCKCVDQRGEQHTPLHSLVCIITPVCSSPHQPCPEHFLQMVATIQHILLGWSWMWALGLLPTSNWCKHYVVWAHSMVLRHIHMINSTAVYIESLIMEYRKIFLCEMFTFQGMLHLIQDFSFNIKRLYYILFNSRF